MVCYFRKGHRDREKFMLVQLCVFAAVFMERHWVCYYGNTHIKINIKLTKLKAVVYVRTVSNQVFNKKVLRIVPSDCSKNIVFCPDSASSHHIQRQIKKLKNITLIYIITKQWMSKSSHALTI